MSQLTTPPEADAAETSAPRTLPPPIPPSPVPSMRDRFVAFAFVAADLLVEASPDGVISFAAGAFVRRLGRPADAFHGRHVRELIAPVDQASFSVALATAAAYGRSPPLIVRLADTPRTPVCVSSLLIPGPSRRLCLTFGAAPAAATGGDAARPLAFTDGMVSFVHEASLRLRADAGASSGTRRAGSVALLEIKGGDSANPERLRADIGDALAACAADGLAGEMAAGRFGLLSADSLDVASVVDTLSRVAGGGGPARGGARVDGRELSLSATGLGPAEATRALRFALSAFAASGLEGVLAAGGAKGLAGILAAAEGRAETTSRAIAAGQFRLEYQPVSSLADRRPHHYEALLRPAAPPGGAAASPQTFVAFAELVGLAEKLDAAVLRKAAAALAASQAASIAVNVSGVSIQSAAFCEQAVAASAGLGGRLMVELTETADIEDMGLAASHMAKLRAAGIRLCLDDFGAGAASFRYLREFPVDFIKIDGLYVRGAARSPRDRGFVASIVDLAASAGAETVAEMVETEEQASLMRELGVRFGQGWLFGRAAPLP